MNVFRLFALASFLLLLGCSDSPESAIDDIADKSKELVQSARELSEDAAEQLTETLGTAKKSASETFSQSVETLREQ